ncbi:hypothetical protein [uncultured Legionella sp.]|uniref:hypothetical protein n=1 Tax=uncultured Legionella sp. TaxID=210934 RepID=UPI0026264C5C|nr:hypothetical protein [uncultured Legionella sp.]
MAEHTFTTTLFKDDGLCQTLRVSFNYFLPDHHMQWQDPQLGSIALLEVQDVSEVSILSSLTINEHLKIRHECWSYIETHHLAIPHPVVPIR